MHRLSSGPAHRKAIVFVDNAGSDIILGMLPFVRELLKRGTQVVIAANEIPSINDITAREMVDIAKRAAAVDPVFSRHLAEGSFKTISSGSDLPVIDLRQVRPLHAVRVFAACLQGHTGSANRQGLCAAILSIV